MHDMPAINTVDAEDFEQAHSPEVEEWYVDYRFAKYGLEDGIFAKYRGTIIAIFEKQIVGKGKNPLHLRRRIAKKLGIDALRMILVDPEYGIL